MMKNFDTLRLDGHALRVFVAVCETGSVSKTADLFNLNQSTISHTLEKLRSAIGDPLFVKAGRGITHGFQIFQMAMRMAGLAFCCGTKYGRHIIVALYVRLGGKIEVTTIGL